MVGKAAALAGAAALLGGVLSPAHAFNPIMHNSSSVGSTYWGGGWGNTPNSKYGQFTCSTCHTTGLSGGGAGISKQIRTTITSPKAGDNFPGSTVVFGSYTAFGKDTSHSTSTSICEVCHSQTSHHRYNNVGYAGHNGTQDCTSNGGCHVHSNGFKKPGGAESAGGNPCGGCHSDLYSSNAGNYSMHSNIEMVAYKHYMNNDSSPAQTGGVYGTTAADGNPSDPGRRCTMCHVDHNLFKVTASATAGRAFNLRNAYNDTPTAGGYTASNNDKYICLSCHFSARFKAYSTPNLEPRTAPVPFNGVSYANATSVFRRSTHGYSVYTSYFNDATLGKTTFAATCVKCHNDTINENGEWGGKSSKNGQDGYYKFGEHLSGNNSAFSVAGSNFYQGTVASGSTATTINVSGVNWTAGQWTGYDVVITGGAGQNQRADITNNTATSLTVANANGKKGASLATIPAAGDTIQIVQAPMPPDNLCFSCHSQAADGFKSTNGKDWYGSQTIPDSSLELMYSIFVGDSGPSTPGATNATSITVTTKKSWGSGALTGYIFVYSGGRVKLTGNSASVAGSPYSTTINWTSRTTIGTGAWRILKPASHPLDTYGRHTSYERVAAPAGGVGSSMTTFWNLGDQGTDTAATANSNVTTITDSTKSWGTNAWANYKAFFPNKGTSAAINSNTATVLTLGSTVNIDPGEPYYIGDGTNDRHVSCADCHNTHAASFSPEGTVTSGGSNTLVDTSAINTPGWSTDQWKGFLIRNRTSAGVEQIRYVTGYDNSTGTWTVSLPWSTTPAAGDSYTVLTSEQWNSSRGQDAGRAGSGSTGGWGVKVSGYGTASPTLGSLIATSSLTYSKIENVGDRSGAFGGYSTSWSTSTLGAGQKDLCMKCHSYYAYKTSPPTDPSGNPDGSATSETDIAAEFNPNNLAHHAVYARGQNQPIRANFGNLNAGVQSSLNPNWPKHAVNGYISSGYVTLTAGTLPNTVRPGWFMYVGSSAPTTGTPQTATSTTGWVEITDIVSASQFYVRREKSGRWPYVTYDTAITIGTSAAPVSFAVTAGLGNNFVPPYGPWAVLVCTDCHGSTKTDPVGPHASTNNWLIKDADQALQMTWMSAGAATAGGAPTYGSIAINTGVNKKYFCFNCHRRDVYLDDAGASGAAATYPYGTAPSAITKMARIPHGNGMEGTHTQAGTASNTKWGVHCRNCHAGDKVGGIHGTNSKNGATASGTLTNMQGKRFLNGAAWGTQATGGGVKRSTTTAYGACYTNGTASAVNGCSTNHSGSVNYNSYATYDYDNP